MRGKSWAVTCLSRVTNAMSRTSSHLTCCSCDLRLELLVLQVSVSHSLAICCQGYYHEEMCRSISPKYTHATNVYIYTTSLCSLPSPSLILIQSISLFCSLLSPSYAYLPAVHFLSPFLILLLCKSSSNSISLKRAHFPCHIPADFRLNKSKSNIWKMTTKLKTDSGVCSLLTSLSLISNYTPLQMGSEGWLYVKHNLVSNYINYNSFLSTFQRQRTNTEEFINH